MKEKIEEEIEDTWNNPGFKVFCIFILIIVILFLFSSFWESGCEYACQEYVPFDLQVWCDCSFKTFLGL